MAPRKPSTKKPEAEKPKSEAAKPEAVSTEKTSDNCASCILNTALANQFQSYQPGDTYTATLETIQRLIDRGMAKPVEI